jgi:hypothetical protein
MADKHEGAGHFPASLPLFPVIPQWHMSSS